MADKHSLKIHMDGARFANAVAALGLKPRQVTWECGVDVLCFGGTKNGLAVGEAVVFFDKALAEDFDYRCKQAGQLASKMRFIAAGWHGILSSGAWLRNAAHANACARQLEGGLKSLGLSPLFPCEANSVFVKIPEKAFKTMHDKGWHFYNFIGVDACRFMCSWDTTEESVRDFLEDLKSSL
jgi:threonine aldolase